MNRGGLVRRVIVVAVGLCDLLTILTDRLDAWRSAQVRIMHHQRAVWQVEV